MAVENAKYDPWALEAETKPGKSSKVIGDRMASTGPKRTTVKKLRDRPKSKTVLRTKLLKRKAPVSVTRLTITSLGQKMTAPAKFRQVSQALKSASQGRTDMSFERFRRVLGQCALDFEDRAFRPLVASCPGSTLGTVNWQDFLGKFVDQRSRADRNAKSMNDLLGLQGQGL